VGGGVAARTAAAPDWSGLEWLQRNLTLVDEKLFEHWTTPPPPQAARIWAHDTLKRVSEMRVKMTRRGFYKVSGTESEERGDVGLNATAKPTSGGRGTGQNQRYIRVSIF
jgi:hypothetical protein